ncbi:LysR family transcriptional regulator [Pseudoalteromonas sp. MMG010]|uniref:LysR family transcriptional regulator n=1 Tax=Pseudoalteromonas sp. MMG010 TaxID=2822685 RepID=UPI001B39F4C4|nr:LysR family transcriptional regulator [Pseudoalteromonas sp. MMG010]MBQ4833528.1 LysR family transcriptional regulator [Pseudoalteromonas sp. MMG010]
MDTKILKSFVSVANHKSFSLAADELHTVQPAISRHISSLEAALGVTLFQRTSREVVITPAGVQLFKDATAILSMIEQATTQVKLVDSGKVGTLKVAYFSSACLSFMSHLIKSYKQRFPMVKVSLYEMTASEQIEAFKNDAIDVAFSRVLPSNIKDHFITEDIYTDKLVAVVHDSHPLAGFNTIDLAQLKNEPMIIFNRNEAYGLFDETIIQCNNAGFSPQIISQPRNMQTLLTEVAAGLGVAIAPYCISKLYSEGCHYIALNDVNTPIPLQMQYKKKQHSATLATFVDLVLSNKENISRNML